MQLRQGVLKTMTSCDTLMHFKLHFIVCARVGVYLKMCVDMEVREPPAGARSSGLAAIIYLLSHLTTPVVIFLYFTPIFLMVISS